MVRRTWGRSQVSHVYVYVLVIVFECRVLYHVLQLLLQKQTCLAALIHITYRCLTDIREDLFEGCVVCVTGASKQDCSRVKKLVEQYDGLYVPYVDLDNCSHLLVWKAEGR